MDNTKIQLLINSHVLTALSAGDKIVLTKFATNDKCVELAIDLSKYSTQTEINNIRHINHNLTTDGAADTITQHSLNGVSVRTMAESTHLNIETQTHHLNYDQQRILH